MSQICLLQNDLFQGFGKVVATDKIEDVLDVPEVPVPYNCVTSFETQNPDQVMENLNTLFADFKIKGKDFIKTDEASLNKVLAIFNIVNLCVGSKIQVSTAPVVKEVIVEPVVEAVVVEETPAPVVKEVVVEPVVEAVVVEETPVPAVEEVVVEPVVEAVVVEETPVPAVEEVVVEPVVEAVVTEEVPAPAVEDGSTEVIAVFGIPKGTVLSFNKDKSVTCVLEDDKQVVFEGEVVSIIDAAKKAFKKTGVSGLPSGLGNWLYNEKTLKVLKEEASV